jgi:hypothetical protein
MKAVATNGWFMLVHELLLVCQNPQRHCVRHDGGNDVVDIEGRINDKAKYATWASGYLALWGEWLISELT